MKILVLGAGAIGSVLGGFLAKDGHRVILLGKNQHIEAINREGLFIEGIWGKHHIKRARGYLSLNEILSHEGKIFDLVLLSVKSYDTREMIGSYAKNFTLPCPVVSLQNGLGNLETIAAILGKDRVIGARVIFGAEIVRAGKVKVTVYAEEVILGGVKGGIDYQKVEEAANLFRHAGIPTLATSNIEGSIWGKVLYNCALNALASILGVNYGALLARKETREIMAGIVKEFFLVSDLEGIALNWNGPEEYLRDLFERLIPATCHHFPSMLSDLKLKGKTEIDALNGAIVSLGEKAGISLPVNKIITQLVKAKESSKPDFIQKN